MFTGIVEQKGLVSAIDPIPGGLRLTVRLAEAIDGRPGDSIAVNGCCLTAVNNPTNARDIIFDVSPETLSKTNLGQLSVGSPVNLERAMALGDRLGGHLVSGHVDALAELQSRKKLDGFEEWIVSVPRAFAHLLIPKGSICLDGVSLTVNALKDTKSAVEVMLTLIPTTLNVTTFAQLPVHWKLNVELDMMGKYMARYHEVAKTSLS